MVPLFNASSKNPALIKLHRSRYHLGELENLIERYNTNNPTPLLLKEDAGNGKPEWVVSIANDICDSLSVCLGDVIHNARSSLDLLANILLADAGGTPTKRTYFPFVENSEKLPERLAQTGLDALSPHSLSILKSHPPAHDKNPLLYACHHLDIVDKHRSILPVAAHLQVKRLEIGAPYNYGIYDCRLPLVNGSRVVGRIPSPISGIKYSHDGYPIFTIEDADLGFIWSTACPEVSDDLVSQIRSIVAEVENIVTLLLC
jgi:hypothetical protein